MSAPIVDQVDPVPPVRSFEDHLDAERAALAAERTEAAHRSAKKRLTLIRSAGLGLALAGTIGLGWQLTHPADSKPKFCTADGFVGMDGEALHRDPDQDCAWVDADAAP